MKCFSLIKIVREYRVIMIILIMITGAIAEGNPSSSSLNFRPVSSVNSLSQSSVLCMAQDSSGFLWIGTKDGLNRFDGYEFITYKYDPSDPNTISGNEISCLEIQDGRYLWIGTRSAGINRFDLTNGQIIRYTDITSDGLVRQIYIDSDGRLWLATSDGLLLYMEYEAGQPGIFQNISKNILYHDHTNTIFQPGRKNIAIVSILEYEEGQFLLGAEEGLFEYGRRDNSFRSVSAETINLSVFTKIYRDSHRQLWAASYDGLARLRKYYGQPGFRVEMYNSETPVERRLPVDWVEDLAEDHHGDLWLGTRGGGVTRIRNNEVAEVFGYSINDPFCLPDNIINSLLIDRTGILWIGTESKGLVYLDLYAKQFKAIFPGLKEGVSDNQVTAVTGKGNKIWAGTASAGIDLFEILGNVISKKGNIPRVLTADGQWKSEILSLLYDRDGDLWIGSAANSLTCYTKEGKFESYSVDGFIFALFEDDRGNIWFGTWGQGVGYINKSSRNVIQFNESPGSMPGISSDKVLAIFQDSRDYLWLGTKGGGLNVAHIDDIISGKGRFTVFRHDPEAEKSLSYNDVYDIAEDHRGNIWVATGRGVNMLSIPEEGYITGFFDSGNAAFNSINEQDGLPGGLVHSIQEDMNGQLWLGTNNGLSRISPSDSLVVSYRANDGLSSAQFNPGSSYFNDKEGVMVFGGVNGLTVFNPDSIAPNPFDARVKITGLRLRNHLVEPNKARAGRILLRNYIFFTDEVRLAWSDKEISFEFSALHFSSPGNIRYAYRLLGFNDQWQETGSGNRRAIYTNLRNGEYLFQVRATNNDGVWSPEMAELKMVIAPPLYRTIPAYLFYILIIMLLLYGLRKYSIIGIEKKNKLIIESLQHKNETEIAEAKMRFFTNISHEIRTPLTLIKAPLQQLIEEDRFDSETRDVLVMIFRNVKRLANQVNQLLELRKMEKGQYTLTLSSVFLEELFHEITPDFESVVREKKIKVEIKAFGNTSISADKRLVETIIYNLLSNSFKFSPPGGWIKVFIQEKRKEPRVVSMKVCDNGPGIPEHEIPNIFNRFYQLRNKKNDHLGGSGIGLSIVKEFVERHSGSVEVTNLHGGGCCFEVFFPAAEAGYKTADNAGSTADVSLPGHVVIEESTRSSGRSMNNSETIVIVEDDADLAGYLEKVFVNKFHTRIIADGNIARDEIVKIMPDLVICDIMLPGQDGIQLTEYIKSTREISHIPVIMLTARSEEDNVIQGLNAGADSYISKPFNINILLAQVRSVLKSREAFRKRFSNTMVLEPAGEPITPVDQKFLLKLMEVTEKNLADPLFDVTVLIEEMHMSHSIFLKKVKALTGMTLVEFIRSIRIKKAVQILKQDKLSVSDVCYMVGFSDPKYFSRCFSKETGKKPTDFIREIHG
jgi:signal transduction histidine kinase/ligand-binding sensor domain-containing protein/DNA-binding NarL/FixJ family response regulator